MTDALLAGRSLVCTKGLTCVLTLHCQGGSLLLYSFVISELLENPNFDSTACRPASAVPVAVANQTSFKDTHASAEGKGTESTHQSEVSEALPSSGTISS